MARPYSTTADVLNNTLQTALTDAGWNVLTAPTDVDERISEGDDEIDARLAALGYALPFVSNPTLIKRLSVLYARYACYRDLYAGGSPSAGADAIQNFKDQFEELFQKIESGWASLVASDGSVVAPTSSKFGVKSTQNTAIEDVAPHHLISSYVSESDADDGLSPSEGGIADGGVNNEI